MKKYLVVLFCVLIALLSICCQITNDISSTDTHIRNQENDPVSTSEEISNEPTIDELQPEQTESIQIISLQELTSIPNDVNLSGVIVTGKYGAAYPDIESINYTDAGTGQPLPEQITPDTLTSKISSFSVSPDHKFAAYFSESSTGRSLNIADMVGNTLLKLPILDESGEYLQKELIPGNVNWNGPIYWLDNETLVFEKWPFDMSSMDLRPRSLIVYKPFSGSVQEFPRNYPYISEKLNYSVNWENSGYSGMGLDPTMTRLVYSTEDYQIILWDIQKNKKIDEYSEIFNIGGPVWTNDGTYFYLAKGLLNYSTKTTQLEINQISQDGKLLQLTHLNEKIKNYHIPYLALSPDHQKLVFQVITDEALCNDSWVKYYPTVLNLTPPYQVTIFCASFSMTGIPIWAPNSQFLLFRSSDPKKQSPDFTTLLAIEENYIVKINEDTVPLGWMRSFNE